MNQVSMEAPALAPARSIDFVRYYELAHEIAIRARHDKTRLTDDERITLSVIAAQAALTHYIEPSDRDAKATLDRLLRILDHHEMIEAMTRKMQRLIEQSEHRAIKARPKRALSK